MVGSYLSAQNLAASGLSMQTLDQSGTMGAYLTPGNLAASGISPGVLNQAGTMGNLGCPPCGLAGFGLGGIMDTVKAWTWKEWAMYGGGALVLSSLLFHKQIKKLTGISLPKIG